MSEEKSLSANAQKILELIEKLTLVETSELVEAMEAKFGISAAPVAVAAGAGAAAAAEDEGATFTVTLKDCGANKIGVIKLVREITGLGLGEAKTLAEAGGTIKENVEKKEADELLAKFKEVGATAEAK